MIRGVNLLKMCFVVVSSRSSRCKGLQDNAFAVYLLKMSYIFSFMNWEFLVANGAIAFDSLLVLILGNGI